VASINALAYRTSFAYDAASQQIQIRDANLMTTTSVFDPVGRTRATINANLGRTTQVYDPISQRIGLIDANGNRNTFTFDAAGRQTRWTDGLGRLTTYAYDQASRQVSRTDARGYRTTYLYDNDSRLVGRRYPDGSRNTFSYDAISERTVMNDPTARTTSTYDAAGRLTRVVNPAGLAITYGYDAVSQRTRLIEIGKGLFTYVYDADGRMSHLSDTQALQTSWTYDGASRVTVARLGNGVRASYLYDAADNLLRLANMGTSGTTISSFAYKLDPVGNRRRVTEVDGSVVTWAYDNTYQLLGQRRWGSNSYAITYTYDPAGNRLTQRNSGTPTTYSYDVANELLTQQDLTGRTTFSYDANGNQNLQTIPGGARTTWTWDFENRATLVQLSTGILDTFTYNADGQRVQKQDSTGTTNHIWDLENILEETNQSNVIQVVYTLQPASYGNLLAQLRGSAVQFYLFDGLGSTDRLTNSSGSVTDSYVYDAFGGSQAQSGSSTNSFRYVGRLGYYLGPDLAQMLLRARFYTPSSGRLISQDPTHYHSSEINLYLYGKNSPLINVDPSGLSWSLDLCLLLYCRDACKAWIKANQNEAGRLGGTILCVKGIKCVCVTGYTSLGGSPYRPGDCPGLDKCIAQHEIKHFPESVPCDPSRRDTYIPDPLPGVNITKVECMHRRDGIECAKNALRGSSSGCKSKIRIMMQIMQKWIDENCKDFP